MKSNDRVVYLQPLCMRTPNANSVYQFSKLRPIKKMGLKRFLLYYLDSEREIKVYPKDSLSLSDLNSNYEPRMAYSFAHDGWYIIV